MGRGVALPDAGASLPPLGVVVMLVENVMTPTIVTISADASLIEAAAEMKEHNIGCLPVVEENEIIGVISDRDIVVRALARQMDPAATPVRAAATHGTVCCRADQTLQDAARLMERHNIRRLLVLDYSNRPVGIVSIGDLAAKGHDVKLAGEVLEDVCALKK